ncbi:MBL fold metallo-hydrolase [Haloarcula sp. 1CSR25-25]|uniref:MBL fold metallo-hydrolase n=1 Tax=Haloarcula sp. 1CSR25-25 TaxID=2862545 RepID=UPI0028954516|nr:MBL fold metallo-hydrolase [Haloarcula sp. 1CSR25-25]MDT3436519.1 MBL fold metallo-hydrolase [Haloarcula sp. 1CSR25-25]
MATVETEPGIANGIHLCGSKHVNWYLIEESGALTVVDTGFPTHWQQFREQIDVLDYSLSDIDACLLTHAHPDHIGFAERLRTEGDVPLWLHESGVQRAKAGGNPPLGGFIKNLWRPAVFRYFIEVFRSDGTSIRPPTTVETFDAGTELDVPGHPQVIHVPGHTEDEVVLYLPDRRVLFCGDALATVDFETWQGDTPQLMPPWLNVDHGQAQDSVRHLDSIGEVLLLPGHGDPWTGDLSEAIRTE